MVLGQNGAHGHHVQQFVEMQLQPDLVTAVNQNMEGNVV
jgi:hypothetical protein